MARGPRKHLKRIAAPKQWGLNKMGGYWAPRPRGGPHKLRESIPMVLVLRNKLRFALTLREAKIICQERNVMVDGTIKKDHKFPAGFMDVLSIGKIDRHYRVLFDTLGRFQIHKIPKKEAGFKLSKVVKIFKLRQGYPAVATSDGRVIRYVTPGIKINDSLKISLPDQKILKIIPYKVGALCMADCGRNCGRVGEIMKIEKHQATFDIVYCKDLNGHVWTTRKDNVFVIGENKKSYVSLPTEKGVKLDPVQFRAKMMKQYVEKRKLKSKEGFSMTAIRDKIKKQRSVSRKKKEKLSKKVEKKKVEKKDVVEAPSKEYFETLRFRRPKKVKAVKKDLKKGPVKK